MTVFVAGMTCLINNAVNQALLRCSWVNLQFTPVRQQKQPEKNNITNDSRSNPGATEEHICHLGHLCSQNQSSDHTNQLACHFAKLVPEAMLVVLKSYNVMVLDSTVTKEDTCQAQSCQQQHKHVNMAPFKGGSCHDLLTGVRRTADQCNINVEGQTRL